MEVVPDSQNSLGDHRYAAGNADGHTHKGTYFKMEEKSDCYGRYFSVYKNNTLIIILFWLILSVETCFNLYS